MALWRPSLYTGISKRPAEPLRSRRWCSSMYSAPFWAEILSTQTCQSVISPLPTVVLCFTFFFPCTAWNKWSVCSSLKLSWIFFFFCAAVGMKSYMGGRSHTASLPCLPASFLLSQCRLKWRVIPVRKRTKGSCILSGEKGNCRFRKKTPAFPSLAFNIFNHIGLLPVFRLFFTSLNLSPFSALICSAILILLVKLHG